MFANGRAAPPHPPFLFAPCKLAFANRVELHLSILVIYASLKWRESGDFPIQTLESNQKPEAYIISSALNILRTDIPDKLL